MKKLIAAYLKHIRHYLGGNEILYINVEVKESAVIYNVRVVNECLNQGSENVDIELDELLVFLFERQA